MNITQFAITKKFSTFAIALALIVFGLYGLLKLPVNFLPEMVYPKVKLYIYWPGATPDEIEMSIADPIERQMMSVNGLDYLDSSSIEGMYVLIIYFGYGEDVNIAYQDATEALARVVKKLPKDIQTPVIFKADPSQIPILEMTIRSELMNMVQLRTWTEEWLQDRILAVKGVAGTEIVGGLIREIRVHIKPEALEKYQLSLVDIAKKLNDENIEQFGGRVTVGSQEIIARTMASYDSVKEIGEVVVYRKGTQLVKIKDIADVIDTHREARMHTRVNQLPAIKMSVLKQSDDNTAKTAKAVEDKIKMLKKSLPDGIELGIVNNQGVYVTDALDGVTKSALEAIVLVIIVAWLFLGSWRQAVVIVTALVSILTMNFALMQWGDFSLNIFSMGGLVIAIGVLVDNSILVIEAISKRHEDEPQKSIHEVTLEATDEIRSAVIAATFAFLALFVPFLMVPGLISLLFRELILVIAGIVIISMLTAITITPLVTTLLLKNSSSNKKKSLFERFFAFVTNKYTKLLSYVLKIRYLVFIAFVLFLGFGVYLSGLLGAEFLPKIDDGRVVVRIKLPTGSSVSQTNEVLKKIEQKVSNNPLIETTFAIAGGKPVSTVTYEVANSGQVNIQLVAKDKRDITTKQFIKKMRKTVSSIDAPGVKIKVFQEKVKGIKKLGNSDIELKIKGSNLEEIFGFANTLSKSMKKLDELTNVQVAMDMTKPEYQVNIDRVRASELGISVADVSKTLRAMLIGLVSTKLIEGDYSYDIRLMMDEKLIKSKVDLENLFIPTKNGSFVRLKEIAQIKLTTGPVEIVRENQVKMVVVSCDVNKVTTKEALAKLKLEIEKMNIPSGCHVEYGGEAQMIGDMVDDIILIMSFALFFSYIVLTVQFNNMHFPMLILGSMPFALVGSVGLLYLTNTPLGATVIIGILVVLAAVVNAGVLLFTYAKNLQERDSLSATNAIIKAASLRLRPIVMVSTAILLGLVPLALALEAGSDMLQPMAIAAIGGLFVEVFVALFFMPCLYVLFSRK
ncbi:MAG: HAE1 family hydrophobic/amphiphilic exporter-1 [Sulfurimonas sp.]|jgi:HAE1 family hydrophobic/amphiphilic exporter-1